MPVAHINILQGHSKETLKNVIRDVSQVIVDVLSAPKDRLEVGSLKLILIFGA